MGGPIADAVRALKRQPGNEGLHPDTLALYNLWLRGAGPPPPFDDDSGSGDDQPFEDSGSADDDDHEEEENDEEEARLPRSSAQQRSQSDYYGVSYDMQRERWRAAVRLA